MDKSRWSLDPLGAADADDSESRMGSRRRDSEDNVFEILPKFLIRSSNSNSIPGIEGDELSLSDGQANGSVKLGPKRVMAIAGGCESLGIVLDSELLIIGKDSELDAAHRVAFSSTIDFVLWRRSILLIGLSSSEIVLVDPRTYEIRESKKLSADVPVSASSERFFVDAAIHSNPDPTKIDVIAVGKTGILYLFNNIALSDGSLDSTHDQNVSVDIDIGSIRGTRTKVLQADNANVVCAISVSRNIVVIGEANGTISLHDLQQSEPQFLSIFHEINVISYLQLSQTSLKKIVHCEGFLFVLLSNGKLEILLNDVLFPTEPFKIPGDSSSIVYDFSVVLTGESEVKLWVVYGKKIQDVNYEIFVGIFSGPSFKPEFLVKLPQTSSETNEPDYDSDSNFLFPSQTTPFEEPFALLKTSKIGTKIFLMLETSTDAKLQKLLLRGKFDQATSLAIQYGKDLDIVYKAKAKTRFVEVVGLKNLSISDKTLNTFQDMMETLTKIQDAAFVCGFCSQEGLPEINWIKELLGLGKARVKDCNGTESGKNLLLILKKFFTFQQVLPNGSTEEWVAFASTENTMFQQCKWFLDKLEFDKCERVWRRHFDEFIPTMTLNHFGPFFLILFRQKLNTSEAVSLLKCILPYAVEKCAEGETNEAVSSCILLNEAQLKRVCVLMEIVKKRVCFLEREKEWPSEAMDFSEIVISVVNEEIVTLEANRLEGKISTQLRICKEILEKMKLLFQNLVELMDLKQHHSIRIPFQQFVDEDVIEVVNSLLYELFHKEEIERFINKFLVPFAKRKGILLDRLFSEHVKSVVADLPFYMSSIDIPHEERLICLVTHINCAETKLRSVLKIAQEWPVPWSSDIDNMIVTCLRMNPQGDTICSDLQRTINIMRIQVPFRCLLNKYRLSAPKVQSYTGVVMALTRIIKVGKPEYHDDCLELIKHTGRADEAKIQSLKFSLNQRNLDSSVDSLVSPKWKTHLLKRLMARMFQEFRAKDLQVFNEDELKRLTDISKILANILDYKKSIEFLKLREFIPNLDNCDIVYDEKYPFCALTYIMTTSSEKSKCTVIEQCKKLSDITFTHFPDILIAAAAYYAQPTGSTGGLTKLWTIIQHIVSITGISLNSTNGNGRRIVQSAAFQVAQFLICSCPYATNSQLETLHEFIIIMTSFNEDTEVVVKMLSSFRVFWSLREQEIPQEKEFLAIYKWMFVDGIPGGPGDVFFKHLFAFGSTILKFGDKDLFKQAFGCIQTEFLSRAMLLVGQEKQQIASRHFAKRIENLRKQIYASYEALSEPESDKQVIELIEELKEAGISVNPYALRQRDKSRLLKKLLGMSCYSLAAHVALVFEVYADHDAWSKILNGFMQSGDHKELRKVLVNLRNVSELWMLPEFASGWRKISETDNRFQDLCPIPLD